MRTFNEIAAQSFNLKETDIRDNLSAKDIPGWDSMNYLLLIAELEKEYRMSFSMDEVLNAKNLGDLRRVVETKKKTP